MTNPVMYLVIERVFSLFVSAFTWNHLSALYIQPECISMSTNRLCDQIVKFMFVFISVNVLCTLM